MYIYVHAVQWAINQLINVCARRVDIKTHPKHGVYIYI